MIGAVFFPRLWAALPVTLERVDQNDPESTSDRAELARSACRSRAVATNLSGFDMAPWAMLNPHDPAHLGDED